MEYYRYAFEIDDGKVDAYNNYGLLVMNVEEDYEKALKYFERAIEVDSEYTLAHYNKSLALINLERYEKAAGSLRRVLKQVSPESSIYERARDLLNDLES